MCGGVFVFCLFVFAWSNFSEMCGLMFTVFGPEVCHKQGFGVHTDLTKDWIFFIFFNFILNRLFWVWKKYEEMGKAYLDQEKVCFFVCFVFHNHSFFLFFFLPFLKGHSKKLLIKIFQLKREDKHWQDHLQASCSVENVTFWNAASFKISVHCPFT